MAKEGVDMQEVPGIHAKRVGEVRKKGGEVRCIKQERKLEYDFITSVMRHHFSIYRDYGDGFM